MARTIVVNFNGKVSEFGLTRVDRKKLYGRKMKIVVDENEEKTQTAYLTRDGTALLPSGTIGSLYVNDDYDVCSRADLVAVDLEDNAIEKIDSTLGVEQELEGPIDPRRVLDHTAKAVYQLDADSLDDELKTAMEAGDIFETRFNYRAGFEDAPAFLFEGDEGFFAIIGNPAEFAFLEKERAPETEEEDDDEDPFDDDELDFGMF